MAPTVYLERELFLSIKDIRVHRKINHFYYMLKAYELNLLKGELMTAGRIATHFSKH